jgi:MFS family permease
VKRSLRANIKTIYLMATCHSFMVVTPVFVPLLQGHGLSMAEVLQTQALFALTVALFEVPSGYLADVWGRKLALVIGGALNGLGFLVLLNANSYVDFLYYEFILGISISLISGADLALLYDTESALAETAEGGGAGTSRSLSRLISIEAGASGAAGLAASALLIYGSMNLLLSVQAVTAFVPFLLALLLVEVPRPKVSSDHAGNARQIIDLMLFGKPVVLWTTLAIIAFGLLSLYSFWLYQKYWQQAGVEISGFGYIWAAFALTVSLAAGYAGALEQRLGWRRLLILTALLPLVGLMGMALASGWIGVCFGFAIQIARGLSLTVFYDALNRRVPGDFRATVNSMVSLGVRAVFIVTGPVLGYLLDAQGLQWTLLLLVVVFGPLFALVIVGLGRRVRRESNPALGIAVPVN